MSMAQNLDYAFAVDISASKREIAKALEKMFGVHVMAVRTLINKGKTKRQVKSRKEIFASNWKKAIVRLKEGEKIDLFEVSKS